MASVAASTRSSQENSNGNSGAESEEEPSGKFSKKDFIAFVKSFPILYDVTKELYRDKTKKEEAWQAIAEACSMTANECKCKWKNIRDSYVKYINTQREGNRMTPNRKRRRAYKYADLLDFMRPFIFTRGEGIIPPPIESERVSMVPVPEEKEIEQKLEDIPPRAFEPIMINVRRDESTPSVKPEHISMQQDGPSLWFVKDHFVPTQNSSKKKRRVQSSAKETSSVSSTEMSPGNNQGDDEDRLFCLSLVPTLRRFDLKTRQAAKIKVQTLLYEMEFDAKSS